MALLLTSRLGLLVRSPRFGSSVRLLSKDGGLGTAKVDTQSHKGSMEANNIFIALNEDQIRAVKSHTGKSHFTNTVQSEPNVTVLLAGAGSGKTRVIVHRIAYLLQNLKVPADAIVATTFTKKAAAEILDRVEGLLNDASASKEKIKALPEWIGTFHSLCNRMLTLNSTLARMDTARFLDERMQGAVTQKILEAINGTVEDKLLAQQALDGVERADTAAVAYDSDEILQMKEEEEEFRKEVIAYINSQKDLGIRAQTGESDNVLEPYYLEYQRVCDESNYVDYNEVLLRTYELLRDHPALLAQYRQQFRYIHVDEFQDTNTIQYMIVRLLVNGRDGPYKSSELPPATTATTVPDEDSTDSAVKQYRSPTLFVVGDDDQAIYAFRGAHPDIMQQVCREYPNSTLIKLTRNYRSTSTILAAANTVIANNKERLGKNLWTAKKDFKDEPIHVHNAEKTADEAAFVAREIQRRTSLGVSKCGNSHSFSKVDHIRKGKAPEKRDFQCKDIAVIARSNVQIRIIERELKWRNIPCQMRDEVEFFEREEIQHILAYLSLVTNRHDNNAFLRVLNVPSRTLVGEIEETIEAYAKAHQVSLWAAAVAIVEGRGLSESSTGSSDASGGDPLAPDATVPAVEEAEPVPGEKKKKKGAKPKVVKAKPTKLQKKAVVLGKFLQLINQLDRLAESANVPTAVKHVIMQCGLYDHYEACAAKPTKSALTYQAQLENLAELGDFVRQRFNPAAKAEGAKWVSAYRGQHPNLSDDGPETPLSQAEEVSPAAEPKRDDQPGERRNTPLHKLVQSIKMDVIRGAAPAPDAVQLMTIHGSKGLEFPVVFLCGVHEGGLPFFRAGYEQLEEDRRLFYVAVTRAQKVLYLTYVGKRFGNDKYFDIPQSRFIDEIEPQSLLFKL